MGSNAPQRRTDILRTIGWEHPLSNQKWCIWLRWLLVVILASTTPVVNRFFPVHIPLSRIFVICILTAVFNGALHYSLIRIRKGGHRIDSDFNLWWNTIQIAVDWAAVVLLFHYTGGAAGFYVFYFLFHAVLTGVHLPRENRLFYVAGIAVLLDLTAAFEWLGIVDHIHQASFIPLVLQQNAVFVLMVMLFFDVVLFSGVLLVQLLMRRLNRTITEIIALQERMEAANEQLSLLNQLAKDTTRTFGFYPRLRFICQQISSQMRVKGAAIHLLEEKTKRLMLVSACGLSDAYLEKGPVLADRSLSSAMAGKPHFVLDAGDDPTIQYPEAARKEGIVSILAIPLQARNKFIGTLRLYTQEKRPFTNDEIEFLSALSGQAAVSIENARIYDVLKKQDESKSEFIMMMTHELKAPLMAIQGILEVMQKEYVGPLNEKQKEFISRIHRRIDSIVEVSTGLLDFYQWESRIDVKPVPVPMKEQLQKSVDLYMDTAQHKGLTLDLQVPAHDLSVAGTEADIEIILNNLVSNAIKYTPSGGEINISLSESENRVVLVVSDTGIGIEEQDLPKIFGTFFRTKEAKKKDPYGRGMGLAFVKKIAESMDGSITVDSRKGEGTKFVLSFPNAGRDV